MNIHLQGVSKRFNLEWIFRKIDHTFDEGCHVITGPNGSGKSTLLRILAGHLTPSEGAVSYNDGSRSVDREDIFNYLSISAPYLDLFDAYSTSEMIAFHGKLKGFRNGLSTQDVVDASLLGPYRHKYLHQLSSGTRQRLKTALAILSESSILLLDEPCTNFDDHAAAWYEDLLRSHLENRLVIIASNQEREYRLARSRFVLDEYTVKP